MTPRTSNRWTTGIANAYGIFLVVLIVMTGTAIQQSWSASREAQATAQTLNVHRSEQAVREDWIKSILEEIRQDLKEIKNRLGGSE